ncbi:MAG TPA: response regulator [Candidatus Acidoferrales bacterium]|nr:response regulator [Candidatus Acidoferrales bacterium]
MPTILVADDNSNIQKMVSLAFKEKGISVVAVGNGEAACRKVSEVRPDLILADVFMPVRNGYEVCEFVKQDPEFAETPVILLVGAFDPLDEKEAARVGANGVLKKPFVPPDPLIGMVNALLGRTEPAAAEPPANAAAGAAAERPKIEYTTPRPVPPPPPQEFAFGSDDNVDVEATTTFGEPVAKPSKNSDERNETDEADDLGPENAWAQRRAAADYEIDATDSADLVEKLAGEKTSREGREGEDADILASNKHVPFAGANVPEIPPAASAPKWTDLLDRAFKTATPPADLDPPAPPAVPEALKEMESSKYQDQDTESALEFEEAESRASSKAELELPQTASHKSPLTGAEPLPLAPGPIPFHLDEPAPTESHVGQGSADAPPAYSVEAGRESKIVTWPLPKEAASAEVKNSELPKSWMDAKPEPIVEASNGQLIVSEQTSPPEQAFPAKDTLPAVQTQEEEEATAETSSAYSATPIIETNLDETEVAGTKAIEIKATEIPPADEFAPEQPTEPASAKPSRTEAAQVDDMVAKVMSKLEPQLHQALANGVLRPLVEELLNQQKEKK